MPLLTRAINALEKALRLVSYRASNAGAAVLMAMVLLTVVDITLRRAFNSPLPFSYELIEFLLIIVGACSIAYATSTGRHISIDILTMKFPPKARAITDWVTDLVCAAIFGLLAWRSVVLAIHMVDANQTTGVLEIPLYPFALIVAFGTTLASLLMLVKAVKSITGEARK